MCSRHCDEGWIQGFALSYIDLLRDPRWQKRRLEIFHRDNFTCADCDDSKKTLHVHHLYYVKDRAPWDYPDWALETLCEDCHKQARANAGSSLQAFEALLQQFFSKRNELNNADELIDGVRCSEQIPQNEMQEILRDAFRAVKELSA